MARALWSGFVSFGLVNVPVALFAATTDQTIHFHQLHKSTSNRIRYKKVDEGTGDEVAADDIVNGYDTGGGNYVVVDKDELKQVAPGRSETIEISDFVDLAEIDPVHFQQTYYLAPRGKGADRAYALLRQAMEETHKVGIATFVLREKEHLVALRAGEEVLLLEAMYFADELRDARTILENLPRHIAFKGRELTIAKQLIESLSADWSPTAYRNTYRARVAALVEQKRAGEAIVFDDVRPRSNVIDLMSALEASVTRASDRRSAVSAGQQAASDVVDDRQAAVSRAGGTRQRFEQMSRAELLDCAAEVGLRGRSKMSKAELVRALAAAARPARRRQRHAS